MDRTGIYDSFFELGGESLLATRVISRINRLYNIQLPLRRFFETPTIEALASWIHALVWTAKDRPDVSVDTSEREIVEI